MRLPVLPHCDGHMHAKDRGNIRGQGPPTDNNDSPRRRSRLRDDAERHPRTERVLCILYGAAVQRIFRPLQYLRRLLLTLPPP